MNKYRGSTLNSLLKELGIYDKTLETVLKEIELDKKLKRLNNSNS